MNKSIVYYIIQLFIHLILQVIFFKELAFFGKGMVFIYLNFLFIIPLKWGKISILSIGFVYGLLIDAFYHTGGIFTFSSTLSIYLRSILNNIINPPDEFELYEQSSLKDLGLIKFLLLYFPIVFVHNISLFWLDSANYILFINGWLKLLLTTIFTLLFVIFYQLFFIRKVKNV